MAGSRRVLAVCITAFVLLSSGSLPDLDRGRGSAHATSPSSRRAPDPAAYVVPVEGEVSDPFRSPPTRYEAGNRGIEYTTAVGSPVRASRGGQVVFAGAVAGGLHVTIRHDDGLRSSYSFLASIAVRVGAEVHQGDAVGASGPILHFGIRDAEGEYLDPAPLFAGGANRTVRLVPGTEEGADALRAEERRGFLELAARRLAAGPLAEVLPGISGGASSAAVLAHYAHDLQPATRIAAVVEGLRRWHDSQDGCTPASSPAPTAEGRRILVLVAGFGSTSAAAGIDQVDRDALGYAAGDVLRFSYNGGRIPASSSSPGRSSALGGLPASDYGAADSQRDLVAAADRLRELLAEIAAAEPGVPVDVVAHSQGGVVSRLALLRAEAAGTLPADVRTLVTLSSPHGGADLATGLHAITQVGGADTSIATVQRVLGLELDANSEAAAELSEASPLTQDLRDRGVPDQVNFVSVGARGDPVVASPRTAVAGERSVVVDVTGPRTHDRLPGTALVTREIALARAGLGPSCVGIVDAGIDVVVGEAISLATDQAAAVGLVLTAPLP